MRYRTEFVVSRHRARLTHALAGGTVIVLGAALTATPQPALAAAPIRISGVSQQVVRGGQAFIDAAVRKGQRCRLEATLNGKSRRSRAFRASGTSLGFSWRVPSDAVGGPNEVAVRCAGSVRALRRHARVARVTITVADDKNPGSGFVFNGATLRIHNRASRTGEHLRGGLPEGSGDPDAVSVDVPDGTGGAAGYGTFWPLATGTRTQITQTQGGGVSHASIYTRYAIDLGVPTGTAVHAGFGGVVARISNACANGNFACGGGYGNYVLLKAVDGTCSLQAHLSRVDVAPGQQIPKYTVLGLSGYSGHVLPANATGAHLHYDRVDCSNFHSLPWTPAEGGSLAERQTITSQNAAELVCNALQGGCVDPQGPTVNPQGPTVNPQAPPPPPTPPPPTGGTGGPAPAPAPAPTWSETTGGPTNSWTNYTNAGGTQGPTIPGQATVQIACKLPGFRVADGNTWWYRIASAPWNGAFYSSADAFYNNGATSGSLIGTPFVDPAVANC